jgi:hypothetical protein
MGKVRKAKENVPDWQEEEVVGRHSASRAAFRLFKEADAIYVK